jgi:glucose/arabinose dehydrogenase
MPARPRKHALTVALGLVATLTAGEAVRAAAQSHAFVPEYRAPTEALIRGLHVPAGFRVDVFARGLGNPRMMAVGDDGAVYVTRPGSGDAVVLRDGQPPHPIITGLSRAHGVVIHGGKIYLAGVRKVVVADLGPRGDLGPWRTLVDDLPGGGHDRRTLGVGPDGMLYISVGSTCNVCREGNPEHATILRAGLDGRGRHVFARGLRNTMALAWHPDTRELWGMDNGSDHRGDDQPPEELNRIVEGADYGWPSCFGDRQPDPDFTGGDCSKTVGATLGYQAHAAPIWMLFYTGRQFPEEYRGDGFVAFHGSWNRVPPSGYRVVRIRYERGQPQRFEDFLTGFLIEGGRAAFGRPAGLAVTRDGALLVSDDVQGYIYRVSHGAGS